MTLTKKPKPWSAEISALFAFILSTSAWALLQMSPVQEPFVVLPAVAVGLVYGTFSYGVLLENPELTKKKAENGADVAGAEDLLAKLRGEKK